jgi:hypothetical protein
LERDVRRLTLNPSRARPFRPDRPSPNPPPVGASADLLILPAGSIAEAVASRPMDRAVFRNVVMLACGGRLLGAGA